MPWVILEQLPHEIANFVFLTTKRSNTRRLIALSVKWKAAPSNLASTELFFIRTAYFEPRLSRDRAFIVSSDFILKMVRWAKSNVCGCFFIRSFWLRSGTEPFLTSNCYISCCVHLNCNQCKNRRETEMFLSDTISASMFLTCYYIIDLLQTQGFYNHGSY